MYQCNIYLNNLNTIKKMKNQIYFSFKSELKQTARDARVTYKKDKTAIRTHLNDTLDHLIREIERRKLKEELTEAGANQIINRLTSYTCKLHPKKC